MRNWRQRGNADRKGVSNVPHARPHGLQSVMEMTIWASRANRDRGAEDLGDTFFRVNADVVTIEVDMAASPD